MQLGLFGFLKEPAFQLHDFDSVRTAFDSALLVIQPAEKTSKTNMKRTCNIKYIVIRGVLVSPHIFTNLFSVTLVFVYTELTVARVAAALRIWRLIEVESKGFPNRP